MRGHRQRGHCGFGNVDRYHNHHRYNLVDEHDDGHNNDDHRHRYDGHQHRYDHDRHLNNRYHRYRDHHRDGDCNRYGDHHRDGDHHREGTTTGTSTGTDIPTNADGFSRIDATDSDLWVYVNLAEGTVVSPTAPATSGAWHLGFKRYEIKLNGGSSGAGGVQAAVLEGQEYETLLDAPANGYLSDGDELVFGDWYDYDFIAHTLSPKDHVYVVRGWDDDYYKLEIVNYYDEAGTSGFMTFQYDIVASPSS